MEYKNILDHVSNEYQHILKNNLVGIYVHGSLAFGCFNADKSDIDFLVVVNEKPSLHEKEALIKILLDLRDEIPIKGFEMSVVQASICKNFVYPTPFELHFSNSHLPACIKNLTNYCDTMNGTDKDLAAHFTVTKSVGYPLWGNGIADVFGEVPKADYLDSIKCDIENAKDDIKENPIYVILNLCRVLAYEWEELILSKKQGGRWGMEKLLPQYVPLIRQAYHGYVSEQKEDFNEQSLREFCDYMLPLIFVN